jgi:hypothetical protein
MRTLGCGAGMTASSHADSAGSHQQHVVSEQLAECKLLRLRVRAQEAHAAACAACRRRQRRAHAHGDAHMGSWEHAALL